MSANQKLSPNALLVIVDERTDASQRLRSFRSERGWTRPQGLCSESCSIGTSSAGPVAPSLTICYFVRRILYASFPSWMSRVRSPSPAPSSAAICNSNGPLDPRRFLRLSIPSSGPCYTLTGSSSSLLEHSCRAFLLLRRTNTGRPHTSVMPKPSAYHCPS